MYVSKCMIHIITFSIMEKIMNTKIILNFELEAYKIVEPSITNPFM
jgi:hypothetical protein